MLQPWQFLTLLTFAVVAAFPLILHVISDTPRSSWRYRLPPGSNFEKYRQLRTLSPEEFPIDDPRKRVILLGDIHGMDKPFRHLLDKIAYDNHNDVLVHTGDVISRGSHRGSMVVIDFLATHNITGVRGNNDQKVIEWKGWLDWFNGLPGAAEWLVELEAAWHADHQKGYKHKAWVKSRRNKSRGQDAEWWSLIPKGWIPFGDHYRIARDLKENQYAYLLSLPLKLHIPSAHAFVVHAGLLPYDVRYEYDDRKRQPLARVPRIRSRSAFGSSREIEILRALQEHAILRRVPQNQKPWTNLNIRSIRKHHEISRGSNKGVPWTTYWNSQMDLCGGFFPGNNVFRTQAQEPLATSLNNTDKTLPCYPVSVVHGHSASWGLDLNRYSFGLDTGCVYGRKLTAMIVGPNPLPHEDEWEEREELESKVAKEIFEDDDYILGDDDYEVSKVDDTLHSPKQTKTIKFGDTGTAKIVNVPCS